MLLKQGGGKCVGVADRIASSDVLAWQCGEAVVVPDCVRTDDLELFAHVATFDQTDEQLAMYTKLTDVVYTGGLSARKRSLAIVGDRRSSDVPSGTR